MATLDLFEAELLRDAGMSQALKSRNQLVEKTRELLRIIARNRVDRVATADDAIRYLDSGYGAGAAVTTYISEALHGIAWVAAVAFFLANRTLKRKEQEIRNLARDQAVYIDSLEPAAGCYSECRTCGAQSIVYVHKCECSQIFATLEEQMNEQVTGDASR